MRLFVGLAIPDEVKDVLERVTLRLRAKDDGLRPTSKAGGDPGLRWSTPDQWHVTLAFLGEVGHEARGTLVRELREVRLPPVRLQIDGLGVFERVGILYANVAVTPELLRLHEAVTASVKRVGLEVEDRPYRAHVTLARSRGGEGRKTIARLQRSSACPSEPAATPANKFAGDPGARWEPRAQQRLNERWEATEFLLYESRPPPKGSTYAVQERFGLK